MRATSTLRVLLLLMALLLAPFPSEAQYLYLDANGDGVRTPADSLSSTGPTTVGVWLRTDANASGIPAACADAGTPFTINSYEFILHATGGTVAYGSFVDHMAFGTFSSTASSETEFYAGRGSGTILDPGLYHLASLTIAPSSGTPLVHVAASTPLLPTAVTAFGSQCPGIDYDNTLKLGSDWFETQGLGPSGAVSFPPVVDLIASMAVAEGDTAAQSIRAIDADGDTLTLSKASGPSFMTVATTGWTAGAITGTITLTPNLSHSGNYTGRVQASDGFLVGQREFSIRVTNVPQALIFIPFPDVFIAQHHDSLIYLATTDADGGLVSLGLDSGPRYVSLAPAGGFWDRGLRIFPTLASDVGTALVAVTVVGARESQPDSFFVTVLPNPLPPSVLIQPDVMHTGEEGRVLVQVIDLDLDPIVSLTVDDSAIPPGDARSFTTSNENRNGLLLWTPQTKGIYPLHFSATDTSGATTTRDIDVVVHGARPLVTAPPKVGGIPLTSVSFSVSASSPDGVPLTSLTLDPTSATSFGATFVTDPTFQSGTFTWTPPVAGAPVEGCLCYALTFRATDSVEFGVANTRLELAITDSDTLHTSAFDLLVSNAGQTGFESRSIRGGLFYPPSATTSILFGTGPWLGGKVASLVRMSRGGGDTEFAPGAIVGGIAPPFEPRFRNYRLERGELSSPDYLAWPIVDGAPITGTGTPKIEGKSLLWSLSHDLDPGPRAAASEYGAPSYPIGVELRQTTFVYGGTGPLANIAIVRYRLTNRSAATIESTFVGAFADPDIGNPSDDLAGYDRALEMGYVYNSTAFDNVFAATPPALGIVWLGGSGSDGGMLPCRAFQTYHTADVAAYPTTAPRSYRYLQGRDPIGEPLHASNDKNAPVTTYRFDGDPVAGSGWLDDHPLDKRIILGSGPLNLDPGESVEFTTAIVVGQGANHLASVTDLRRLAGVARYLASTGFEPAPYIDIPRELDLTDGQPFRLHVPAFDPDGDPLTTLTADLSALPAGNGARFDADPGLTGGTLFWTPYLGHAQSFTIRLTAASDRSATFETTLRVRGPNRAPVANAGGPYTGVRGTPLPMSSAASSDPDNDRLATTWDFGDGAVGIGATTGHSYASAGIFLVTVTVSDGFDTATDKTTAAVLESGTARAWESSGAADIRLASPRDAWCFQLEPIENAFPLASISGTVRLVWHGEAGPVTIGEIVGAGPPTPEDRDGNGIPERSVCFSGSEFRALFIDLPTGSWDRVLSLEGSLAGGADFSAIMTLRVVVPGSLRAVVAPNPLNPGGNLTVRTARAGRARVTLHDVNGRAIRTLHDGFLGAGIHDFAIDGRNAAGVRLGSGVYFYRIVTDDGASGGRFTVLK